MNDPSDSAPALLPPGPAARARAEGRDYNIELLRNAMTPLTDPEGKPRSRIPAPYLPVLDACSVCPARCCRLNVKISLPDAVRYCTTLTLPFLAGLTLVPSPHAAHAFRVERDVLINPDPEGWLGTVEVQLQRRADGSCHALVQIAGYERCGVYSARPSMCRLYPMSWSSDVAKGSPGLVLCPIPYAVPPPAEAQFVRDIQRSIDDWELHDDVVLAWHRAEVPERTVRAFLEFTLERLAPVMGFELEPTKRLLLARGLAHDRLQEAMVRSGVVRMRT